MKRLTNWKCWHSNATLSEWHLRLILRPLILEAVWNREWKLESAVSNTHNLFDYHAWDCKTNLEWAHALANTSIRQENLMLKLTVARALAMRHHVARLRAWKRERVGNGIVLQVRERHQSLWDHDVSSNNANHTLAGVVAEKDTRETSFSRADVEVQKRRTTSQVQLCTVSHYFNAIISAKSNINTV